MKKVVVACGSGIATSTAVEARSRIFSIPAAFAGTYNIVKCSIGSQPVCRRRHTHCNY